MKETGDGEAGGGGEGFGEDVEAQDQGFRAVFVAWGGLAGPVPCDEVAEVGDDEVLETGLIAAGEVRAVVAF